MRLRVALFVTIGILLVLSACQTTVQETSKPDIGLIFDLAGRGDNSYNDAAYTGLVKLAKAYDGWIQGDPDSVNFGSQLLIKYVQPRAADEREVKVRDLARSGCPLIYCVGFLFSDAVEKVAKDFPRTHFVIIDAYIPDLNQASNITCLAFKENEGSFLVGAIAALKADGMPIGFLGGMDIPLIHRFENGFIGGAMYADARYRRGGMILSQYTGTTPRAFNDPVSAYQISMKMFKNGTAIIFHAAGGSGDGLFKAAEQMNRYAIGVDSDQGLIYQSSADPRVRARGDRILTSMIKRVDIAVALSGKSFLDSGRRLPGGYWAIGLKDNGLDFAENQYNKGELADVRDRIQQIKEDVAEGKVEVPDIDTDLSSWASSLD